MSVNDIFLVIISGLGVIHGLFLAVFLWVYLKGNKVSNQLLSALLVVLSFRIGKSVFLEFAEHIHIKLIFTGLGSLMAIGPIFYCYVHSCSTSAFRLTKKDLIHFLPAFAGICFGLYIDESHLQTLPKTLFLALFATYYGHYLVYLIMSNALIVKQKKAGINEDTYRLLRLLFYALLAIWVVYVLNLLDEVVPYIIGPLLYSFIAYVISFIIISKGYIQKVNQTKYKTTPVSDEKGEQLYKDLLQLVEIDQQYKNPDLTLKSLSKSLHVSTQVLSMVVNQKSGKNFNGFINHYRIEASKLLLKDEAYKNFTIAAIAMEVGFNSISSFNTAFKKQTGKTPASFRK